MSLFRAFLQIPCADAGNVFSAIPLPGREKDFLAKGVDGAPVFLLYDSAAPQYCPAVHFKHLKALYQVTCCVNTCGQVLKGQFAVVTCDAIAFELHEIFIRCFSAAIESLPECCGTQDLSGCVNRLSDLFKGFVSGDGREVTGLWAELYTIANCSNVVSAIGAWRSDPLERSDFSWGGGCVEVKATTVALRIHHFAVEQLEKPALGCGYVASFMLQSLSGGAGVLDLANAIDAKVNCSPEIRQKLWRNVALSLGSDFSSKLDKHFDVSHAGRNFVLFDMDDIPRPSQPTDPRVFAVRFQVDLTTVATSLRGEALTNLFDP